MLVPILSSLPWTLSLKNSHRRDRMSPKLNWNQEGGLPTMCRLITTGWSSLLYRCRSRRKESSKQNENNRSSCLFPRKNRKKERRKERRKRRSSRLKSNQKCDNSCIILCLMHQNKNRLRKSKYFPCAASPFIFANFTFAWLCFLLSIALGRRLWGAFVGWFFFALLHPFYSSVSFELEKLLILHILARLSLIRASCSQLCFQIFEQCIFLFSLGALVFIFK